MMARRNVAQKGRQVAQQFRAETASLPAPVGGWNARDSLADMDEADAVQLTNWFPSTTDVMVRKGYETHVTGVPSATNSLLVYNGPTQSKMFAAAGSEFFDVSSPDVTGSAGLNFLNLPGAAGDYASTPDSVAVSITGDIDLRALAAPASAWGTGSGTFISKWNTGALQRSYTFGISGGFLNVLWIDSAAGIHTFTSLAPITGDASEVMWVRVTVDVNNGAAGHTVDFYTSTTGVSWTALGTSQTTAGVTDIIDSTAEVEVGARDLGLSVNYTGSVYQATIYNGIGGTLVASMVPEDTTAGDTSWPSLLTGEIWTVQGVATIKSGVVQGLTNSKWQYVNFATSGGNFLLTVNGADKLRGYNGTAWYADGDGSHDITGLDTSTCPQIFVSHRRVWFVKTGSLSVYYLPVDSIAGAATEFPLRSLADKGGYIMAGTTWTIDSGTGADDHTVFVTSQGQVIVYRGIDPSNEVTWSLVGVFNVGSPFSRRCFAKLGGDLLLITYDGLFALSTYLQSDRVNVAGKALTDKIRNAMSDATANYHSNFGWEVIVYPVGNQIILNVPVQDGANQQQYVQNALNGSWCNFEGWDANCWALFNDELYFGSSNFVAKAWSGTADNVANINTVAQQAFNYFGSRGQLKRFTMMRPMLFATGSPAILCNVNVDFQTETPSSALSFTLVAGALWDSAIWDSSVWGGALTVLKSWQGVTGTGYCAAPVLQSATAGIELRWVSTDIVMEPGAVI